VALSAATEARLVSYAREVGLEPASVIRVALVEYLKRHAPISTDSEESREH